MAEKDDILAEAREAYDCAVEAEKDNRCEALEDVEFARLAKQWPEQVINDRGRTRPMLTINKMPAFIRQVVNDARQNKPSIKVHPVDSGADKQTADIINGLIRNIETTSNADVAYDTATEHAVTSGWGYIKVDLDYAHDDTFDLDIRIERVSNPFSIFGDPNSTAADSSDWNTAFEVDWMTKEDFEAQYPNKDRVNWEEYGEGIDDREQWLTNDDVLVAKWWKREEVTRKIVQMTDGQVLDVDKLDEELDPDLAPGVTCRQALEAQGITVKRERETKSWKVTRRILTGAEILTEETWPGIYIPIIPVYGDEVNVEGKRYFRSLIRDAKDAQRMFNYWRTTATELVALAPRVPFIGPKGAFKSDAAKWKGINTANIPYVEYDGQIPPQRQPMDTGAAAGALQEALNAADDMKSIMGLYDASLGARSNETSGKAILARQREGDVSTFHFQDNMARAIRHTGRILIDLIPKVYNHERVIRVLGEDGTPKTVPLKQPVQEPVMDQDGKPVVDQATGQQAMQERIYDLAAGKYDLTVTTGPSFTTRREEAANQMMMLVQSFPAVAPLIGDLIAKNLDWPGSDEIAERIKAANPAADGIPPQVQQQMQQLQEELQKLQQENQSLKLANANKQGELEISQFEAQTDRLRLQADAMMPQAEPHQEPSAPTAEPEQEHSLMHLPMPAPMPPPPDPALAQALQSLAESQMMTAQALSNLAQGQAENRAMAQTILARRQSSLVQ